MVDVETGEELPPGRVQQRTPRDRGRMGFDIDPSVADPHRRRGRARSRRRQPRWSSSSCSSWRASSCSIGALGVVFNQNPVHAALSLVATLFGVAVLFIAEDAQFLAAVQVIVYAGAIVVLFLFVIMLLGVDQADDLSIEPLTGQRPAALVAGVLLGGALVAVLVASSITGVRSSGAKISTDRPERQPAGEAVVHRLPLRVRDHVRPAGDRRGRRGGAGPSTQGRTAGLAGARPGRRGRGSRRDADAGVEQVSG